MPSSAGASSTRAAPGRSRTPGGRSRRPANGRRCSPGPARTGRSWSSATVSRFARDLRTAVEARHDLHARGAVILFADERVLSSDEDEWERWAREAVEAEAYSRRLAKRIREGYAAKRRRLGVPGGNRAPLGTVREGRTMTVDEVDMAVVRRVYELAAGGRTDREVGATTGLASSMSPRSSPTRSTLAACGRASCPPSARSWIPRPGSTSNRCGRGTAAGTAAGSTAASTGSRASSPAPRAAAA